MPPAFPLNVDTLLSMFRALPTRACVLAFLIILSATLTTELNEFRSFPDVNTLLPASNASRARPLVITLDAGQVKPQANNNTSSPSCYPDDNSYKPALRGQVLSAVHRGGPTREEEDLHA